MSFELEKQIISRLNSVNNNDDSILEGQHTVQVLSTKPIAQTTGNERYRVIISDGEYFLQAMLATQLNDLVSSDQLAKNAVILIDRMTTNLVQGKRLLIVLSLRILGIAPDRIGNPLNIQQLGGKPVSNAEQSPVPVSGPSTPAPVQNRPANESKPPPQQRQQPQQPQQSRSLAERSIMPIDALSPYQNTWTIRARVMQKSEIRNWSNQRGEGKLFSVTLTDESGEIRGTAFNQAVDELYPKLEENKVYYISKAKVNLAKKKFNPASNDYELAFERNTVVEECPEAANMPMTQYHFVPLNELESQPKDGTCDVIGILKDCTDLTPFVSKANKQLVKRELTLVDKSTFSVKVTLWGKTAETFNTEDIEPVVAIKGAKVSDFGGRSLSLIHTSMLALNPDVSETYALRGWYDGPGSSESFQAQTRQLGQGPTGFSGFKRSELTNLKQIKESDIGETPINFSTRATVMHIKDDPFAYPACSTPSCSKKVTEDGDGWRCDKCNVNHPAPNWRYMLSMAVSDWSGQAWLSGFNDVGEIIFGMSASQLKNLQESDLNQFNVAFHKALCKVYNFGCRAKQETFNDRSRTKFSISTIQPLDYKEEAYALLDQINSTWGRA